MRSTRVTGGSTLRLEGVVPTEGFIVATSGHAGIYEDVILDDEAEFAAAMNDWFARERAQFADPAAVIGVWHDSDSGSPLQGKVVFDPVEHVAGHEEAIRLGALRGEVEVWDLARRQGIVT